MGAGQFDDNVASAAGRALAMSHDGKAPISMVRTENMPPLNGLVL